MGHVVSIPVLFVSGLTVVCAFPMVLAGIIAVAIVKAVYQYAVTTSQEVIEQNVPMLKRRREEEERARQERESRAALAAEQLQAEISAEIEAEIAKRRPQTVEEAQRCLEQAREDLGSREAEASAAAAAAKERSGGWAELADARDRLAQARAGAAEASALLEQLQGARLLQAPASAGGASPPASAAAAGAPPLASPPLGAGGGGGAAAAAAATAAAAGQPFGGEALCREALARAGRRGPLELPAAPRARWAAAPLVAAPPLAARPPAAARAPRAAPALAWGPPVARALRAALRRA